MPPKTKKAKKSQNHCVTEEIKENDTNLKNSFGVITDYMDR